jgi:DNA-directed RNA polymerase III subunit RPC6
MASPTETKDPRDDLTENSENLYKRVSDSSQDESGAHSKIFFQEDLLSISELPTTRELMPCIKHLTVQGLFRTLKVGGKLGWSVRPRDAAKHILSLDREEKLIYEIIEEAHTNGIWVKDIKRKSNVAQNAVQKSIARMEKANLIKAVKSVKGPAQRTYMLAHLRPSEDVTGNSFFDAGDLDESFRDELLNLIIFWVKAQSWGENKAKRRHKMETDPETGKKRRRGEENGEVTKHSQPSQRSRQYDPDTDFTQLAFRAGTHDYPTAEDIHRFLTSSDAIKPTKAASLTVTEIQGCIDVLVWDSKLEKIANPTGTWGYRTVRGITFKPPGASFEDFEDFQGTGLTQAPCGRCPVFDLCHEGGPVNPQECIYFDQWLKI